MTANYIARIVQSMYDKINLDDILEEFKAIEGMKKYDRYGMTPEYQSFRIKNKAYNRWLKSCSVLECYLRSNYETFVETELVYMWAKETCDKRTIFLNNERAYFLNY
jgi:hypothetical protein